MGEDLGTRLLSKHKRAVGRGTLQDIPGPMFCSNARPKVRHFSVAILRFGVEYLYIPVATRLAPRGALSRV